MTDHWEQIFFSNMLPCVTEPTVGPIDQQPGNFIVKAKIQSKTTNPIVQYWAPNPPTLGSSFSGSGLPFPNPEIAFQNTPNIGAVQANNREFQCKIFYPNSYYVGLGSVYKKPHIVLKVCEPGNESTIQSINLGSGIPYRLLTYPNERSNPYFYSRRNLKPYTSTQEQILRRKAFQLREVDMKANFWNNTAPPA